MLRVDQQSKSCLHVVHPPKTLKGLRQKEGFLILCLAAIAPHLRQAPVLPCAAQEIRAGLLGYSIVWKHFPLQPPKEAQARAGTMRHSEVAVKFLRGPAARQRETPFSVLPILKVFHFHLYHGEHAHAANNLQINNLQILTILFTLLLNAHWLSIFIFSI